MEAMPEEEEAELAAAYRSKGFTPDEADAIAARVFDDPEVALDTIVREELGLDPERARLAVGRRRRVVHRLRHRGEHPGHPVPLPHGARPPSSRASDSASSAMFVVGAA